MFHNSIPATAAFALLCLFTPCQAQESNPSGVPDLTKGGKLTRVNERWAGPLGIHCGAWRPARGKKFEDIRQLLVLEVQKGSPADGVLEVNDVILGADGTGAAKVPLFEGSKIWPMIPIANAITEAEARNPAIINLLVWRKGATKTVPIKLEYLGRYSDTAPYNCEKSKNILRKGIQALYEKNQPDKAGFSVLCLLAADDPAHPDNDKYQARAKEWVHMLEAEGSPWYVGPKLMAMSAIDAPLVYIANYGFNGSDQVVFIAMDGQGKASESTIDFKVSDKDVGVAIYEPFSYPAGPLGGQQSDSSFGFAAPWVSIKGGAGKYKVEVSPLQKTKTASLHYTSLPAIGGRLVGDRHERFSRLLDLAVLAKHKLLDDGGDLWFSLMLEQPNVSFALQGGGTSIGFGSDESKRTLFATFNGKEAGENNNPWSRSLNLRFKDTAPHMIVGRFTWGKDAQDPDKLEIFRVFDAPIYGPMLLEKPVCVLQQTLDQKVFNEISLSVDSGKVVDEIRLGSTLSSVMIGTKPLK